MEESVLLKEIKYKEELYQLNDFELEGVPLWRIVRYKTRISYINSLTDYQVNTAQSNLIGKRRVKLFSGFWKLLFSKQVSICFPFNRLSNIDGLYLDKFIDPVLDRQVVSNDNYIIIDPPSYQGDYPRLHKDKSLDNENRTIIKKIFRIIYYRKQKYKSGIVSELLKKIHAAFNLPKEYDCEYYRSIAYFFADFHYYLWWFSAINPRRVFIVYREGYFPIIAACKKLSISVAEFQHGITLDNTVSYTGDYDPRIDPDYFFVFGNYFKGPQFGMSLERVVPIGWAYKDYINNHLDKSFKQPSNAVLVISSPEISSQMLSAVNLLSKNNNDVRFDVRLHPCEGYNDEQKQILKNIPNAEVVSNKIDSAVVLPQYSRVIGENSTVLYEALSYGCKVGMLNICGLHPATYIQGIDDSFSIIDSPENFNKFMSDDDVKKENKVSFYSDFNPKFFNDFINKHM